MAGLIMTLVSSGIANNISVTNVSLTGQSTNDNYTFVKFDISWENSWRTSSAPNNWDAAWIFVKYKVGQNYVSAAGATSSGTTITVSNTAGLRVGMPVFVTAGTGAFPTTGSVVTAITNSTTFTVSVAPSSALTGGASVVTGYAFWEHATLNPSDYTAPSGSAITTVSDNTGVFLYRDSDGSGTFTKAGVKLRWDYGLNNVADNDIIDVKVFAIEMVYVPQGSYNLGSGGTESAHFYNYPSTTTPYNVSSENEITVGTTSGNLYYDVPGSPPTPTAISNLGDQGGPIPAAFPKGYNAFYCMKYEISQQRFVDFLNTLTRVQQNTRTSTNLSPGVTSVVRRYVMAIVEPAGTNGSETPLYRNGIRCDATIDRFSPVTFYCDLDVDGIGGEDGDGKDIASNYNSWADFAAYLDWACLRPMTELEFEKVCRGPGSSVSNEYAWGTATVTQNTGITNAGMSNETSSNGGNATYGSNANVQGPMRVGAFATGTTTRVQAGASYYGAMEMSGNLWERPVTIGNPTGRTFTGLNGDGSVNSTGDANVNFWPGTDAVGSSFRGGYWDESSAYIRVSDRGYASDPGFRRRYRMGGRGIRNVN